MNNKTHIHNISARHTSALCDVKIDNDFTSHRHDLPPCQEDCLLGGSGGLSKLFINRIAEVTIWVIEVIIDLLTKSTSPSKYRKGQA